MKPTDLASVVLGAGLIALGAFVPAAAAVAFPSGTALIMAGIPQVSQLLSAARAKLAGTPERKE